MLITLDTRLTPKPDSIKQHYVHKLIPNYRALALNGPILIINNVLKRTSERCLKYKWVKQYVLLGPRVELQIREVDMNSNRDATETAVCSTLYTTAWLIPYKINALLNFPST